MFWRAWVRYLAVCPDVDFDLVTIESAPERLRDEIGQQGVVL